MPLLPLERRLIKLSVALATVSLIPALLALTGIVSSQPLLQTFLYNYPPMNLETVVGVILTALTIFWLNLGTFRTEGQALKLKRWALAAAIALIVMTLLTFIFYMFYYSGAYYESLLGILSSIRTSISFLTLSLAIVAGEIYPRLKSYALALLIIPFYLAVTALTGYVIEAQSFYFEIRNIGMSIPTSLSVILLSGAIAVGPLREGAGRVLLTHTSGGEVMRWLLPVALLFPPMGSWVIWALQRFEVYGIEQAILLHILTPSLMLASIIVFLSQRLSKFESRVQKSKIKQEQMRELSRMKDEFLSVLSHEMRTPMSSVIGYIDLLPDLTKGSKEWDQALQVMKKNSMAQLELIDTVLDTSKVVAGKLEVKKEPFNLRSTLMQQFFERKIEMDEKGLNSSLEIAPEINQFIGDEKRIGQVVQNLIDNAIKFTPSGGSLRISAKRIKDQIEIRVEDTGIGLEPDQLENIFEHFWQQDTSIRREYEGLGMGLSLVKYLVKGHGGKIRVESEGSNKGVSFIITLPLDKNLLPSASSGPAISEHTLEKLMGKNILVIEDDNDSRQMLSAMLKKLGATPIEADSAKEGLSCAQSQIQDLILCDLGMPGMDGYEFLQTYKESNFHKQVPAIAITAFASPHDRTRALNAGFDGFVTKPYTLKTLRSALKEVLE